MLHQMKLVYILIIAVYTSIFLFGNVEFSLHYTLISIALYIISNILYFNHRRDFLNFELFFAISFFMASFLSFFILEQGFGFGFSTFSSKESSLVKGLALAMIGYHSYLLGLTQNIKTKQIQAYPIQGRETAAVSNVFCFLMLLLFLKNGGLSILNHYTESINNTSAYLEYSFYLLIACTISSYSNLSAASQDLNKGIFKTIIGLNKLFIFNCIVIIGIFLLSGYRSFAIQIILPIIVCFNIFIHRISFRMMLLIITSGFVLMSFIGMVRGGNEIDTARTFLDNFKDYYCANASLGFFVDAVENKGVTFGTNYINSILAIIPFLQSFVGLFISHDSFAISSSRYFTSDFDTEVGLGTHIIGDIYYSFGLPGVVILMYLLGYFCSRLASSKGQYSLIMMLILTGNAIFAARVEYPYILRMLAYGCIFLYFNKLCTKIKTK